jgi:hypothetical protein
VQTNWCACIRFGRRSEDCTGSNVIGASCGSLTGFFNIAARQADNAMRPEQAPRDFRRHIVRSQMNAIGVAGQGDIDAVVDNQQRVVLLC